MSSSLSEEEFQRMQLQLIELRTENYTIADKCRKQDTELASLRKDHETVTRNLEKATKSIAKSKKAKEVELLIQENDSLQRKLFSQEEEFRLQNSTIMQELSMIVESNEKLEKELKDLKENKQSSDANNESESELRRVQAQNAALQKSINVTQNTHQKEVNDFKETIHMLQQLNSDLESKLAIVRGQPVGDENGRVDGCDGQSDDGTALDELDSSAITESSPRLRGASMMELVTQAESKTQALEEQLKELNNLRLNLDTEREENTILKEQLHSHEFSSKESLSQLQQENDKFTGKLKKKQESYVHLQEEKEKMYSELSKKIKDLEETKASQVQKLKEQSTKLEDDLIKATKLLEDCRHKSSQQIEELEGTISSLQSQVNSASQETNHQLQEQNTKFYQQLRELGLKVEQLKQEKEDLELQLKESQKANSTTLEQLFDAQKERDTQIQSLQEAHRLAEKRKSMLDELAIKYQEDIDKYKESQRKMQETHKTDVEKEKKEHQREVSKLKEELAEMKTRIKELEKLCTDVEPMRTQIQSLEEAKGWLERRLQETEANFDETKETFEEKISSMEQEYKENTESLKEQHETELQKVQVEIEEHQKNHEEHETTIESLKQEIKDSHSEKKLHEKKGASVMKDLKRQLQAERKKAEKLQERLRELLTESKANPQSMEELFRPIDPAERQKNDSGSVSSWSASGLSGPNGKDIIPVSQCTPNQTPPSVVEQENNELLAKLGDIQQEKWYLEEKLSHLEDSNASMAEDLLQKQAIIEHYALEGRAEYVPPTVEKIHREKMTVKRVIDFVKDKGDENLKEVNRKLQRMLEETLTKNMHLQKDLEMLSEEIVRLSKQQVPTTEHLPPEEDITS